MRGVKLERPLAHPYETRGMRRTHVRGHQDILKRLLIDAAGFNLGLVMRTLFGVGTPRDSRGLHALFPTLASFTNTVEALRSEFMTLIRQFTHSGHALPALLDGRLKMASATGS
jgi:transposase